MNPWVRISFRDVARLVHERPEGRAWSWRRGTVQGRPRLQLVNPFGVVFDFRMARGTWLRRAEEP